MLVPYCRTKRQKNHCFNMVRLRKILLAESRGSSRFSNNKVVTDFDFWHFLKNLFSCAIFKLEVDPRDILLAESRGSSRFLVHNVASDFDIGHFSENLIY